MGMSPTQFQQMVTAFRQGSQAKTSSTLNGNALQTSPTGVNLSYPAANNLQRPTGLLQNFSATTTPLHDSVTPSAQAHLQVQQRYMRAQPPTLRQIHYQQPCLQTNDSSEWKRDYAQNGQLKNNDIFNANGRCYTLKSAGF